MSGEDLPQVFTLDEERVRRCQHNEAFLAELSVTKTICKLHSQKLVPKAGETRAKQQIQCKEATLAPSRHSQRIAALQQPPNYKESEGGKETEMDVYTNDVAAEVVAVADTLGGVTLSPNSKQQADNVGLDFTSKGGKLFLQAKKGWPDALQPSLHTPGVAQATKLAFETLADVGFSPDVMVNPQKMKLFGEKAFMEDAVPRMKEKGVQPVVISKFGAAVVAMANKNIRKRTLDGGVDGSPNSSGGHTGGSEVGQAGKKGTSTGTTELFAFFDATLITSEGVNDVEIIAVDEVLNDFCLKHHGHARMKRLFHLSEASTDSELYARLRQSLKNRLNNKRHWYKKVASAATETPRFISFGGDAVEYGKYIQAPSHLGYAKESLDVSTTGDKFVFVVESRDGVPSALAGGALLDPNALTACTSDSDKVDVFIIHADTKSRAKKIRLPGGDIKIAKEIKKAEVISLPVTCLLARYDSKDVKTWASAKGCTEKLWTDLNLMFKGAQAKAQAGIS